MPKISVIVPIYGVEKYLREAVDSILNQTLTNLEILLIDDGSKDNCPQIIDEYAAKDSRIIAIHKENGGYGQSMNVGLERATGEYIAILEPDDFIDSRMYEDLYKIAKEFDSDIVKSCFYKNIQTHDLKKIEKENWIDYIPENKSFNINEYPYFLSYHPSIWSCIYKKEFLNQYKIRFVEAPGAGWTDNPFQVQTMCLAEKINYTSKPYYYWRILNTNPSEELKDYQIPFKRIDEIHKWLKENNFSSNQNIISNLYKRELNYIQIVLGIKTINDINDCYNKIKYCCKQMDENIFYSNFDLSTHYKKIYLCCIKNPQKVRSKILRKLYKKHDFQIRIRRSEILIKLFGIVLIQWKNRGVNEKII